METTNRETSIEKTIRIITNCFIVIAFAAAGFSWILVGVFIAPQIASMPGLTHPRVAEFLLSLGTACGGIIFTYIPIHFLLKTQENKQRGGK